MSNTNGVTWREQCSGKERSHDISAADGPPPGTSSAGARAWVATLWLKWCPLVGFSTSASALMDHKPPSVLQTCWHGLKHTPGHTGVYIFIHTHTRSRQKESTHHHDSFHPLWKDGRHSNWQDDNNKKNTFLPEVLTTNFLCCGCEVSWWCV